MSLIKWLHKNEMLVHMSVMLVVFYALTGAVSDAFYPPLVEHLMTTMVSALILLCLGVASFKAATAATEAIKNAVTQATLEQMRDINLEAMKVKDKVTDLSSANVLVVQNPLEALRDQVETLKEAAEAPPAQIVEKKKRAPRAKSVKKEV